MKLRTFLWLFFLALATICMASCAPSATTVPNTPVAEPTHAPTAFPTAPAATPTLPSTNPTPQVENRLVELEWPLSMRLGDSDIIRLALVPYKEGYIVEAEFPEHQVQTQTLPVERISGYILTASARLDGVGFDVLPAGNQQQDLSAGQPVAWRWSIQPHFSGQHRLAVSVTLVWTPESGNASQTHQALLFSKGIDVKVTSFLGMTRSQAASSGFFGLFLGSGLGLFSLLYRTNLPISRIKVFPPNARLVIESPPDIQLSAPDKRLISALFRRYARLSVEREFLSGYSGSRTFLVLPIQSDGQVDAYTIVKIGPCQDIQDEFDNFETYVRDSLPPITARIQHPPVTVRDSTTAAVQYTFVSPPDKLPVSLRLALLDNPDPHLIHNLFNSFAPNWWLQKRPHVFHLGEEYDRLLPPHYVITPIQNDMRSLHILGEKMTNDRLILKPGNIALISHFTKYKLREDGKSLTLMGKPSPGKAPLRLRWLSPKPPNRTSGQVVATRAQLLEELTRGFDRFGLPDPLVRLDNLLNETVLGTRSIIHGDLNLENILVGPGGFIWLIDFAQTRSGHPLFDFTKLSAEIIAHVIARQVDSPAAFIEKLKTGDPLLVAVSQVVNKCLFNPAIQREYHLAFYITCLGALKYNNLDRHQKHCLYLAAAYICQFL